MGPRIPELLLKIECCRPTTSFRGERLSDPVGRYFFSVYPRRRHDLHLAWASSRIGNHCKSISITGDLSGIQNSILLTLDFAKLLQARSLAKRVYTQEKLMQDCLIIDPAFISLWHPRYDEIEDDEPEYQGLVAQIRHELGEQGFLSKDTFIRVLNWKAPRVKGIARLNDFFLYEQGIANAVRVEDSQKLDVLCQLRGIGAPVGSTLLHLMYPSTFPIIDIRTAETLHHAGLVGSPATDIAHYPAFTAAIMNVANKMPTFTLREVDRALFAYHKIILSPSLKRNVLGAHPKDGVPDPGRKPSRSNTRMSAHGSGAVSGKITIREKVLSVFADKAGQTFVSSEIVDLVLRAYPETKRSSVIPSDYCYNMINADPNSFKLRGFELLSNAQYKWLGPDFLYSGPIYWKNEQVGNWEDGHCELFNDPRK